MSEKINNIEEFDLMMKSILDGAQEEVPERIWEGVSASLDKAVGRKAVVLWWRRTAAGIAAAAAVALGVFFAYNTEDELVPATDDGDLVAVVEPVEVQISDVEGTEVPVLMAMAEKRVVEMAKDDDDAIVEDEVKVDDEIMDESEIEVENEDEVVVKREKAVEKKEAAEYFPTDWGEDEDVKKADVSFVVSGLTGTNNAVKQNRAGMMMRPSVTPAPEKTGIEETSTKSSYGVPLSFGLGVRIGLSPRWSVGTGVNYTFLTRQFFGKYTKVSAAGDIESALSDDIRNQQHYIGIPVNAFYNIINNDKINFYAYAGGTVEKCVSDSYRLMNRSINHSEKVKGVQLSANAGIGVEFMLGKTLGLYIDPSVRYYFKNGNQPKSIRTVQPLMLGFELGLRARL